MTKLIESIYVKCNKKNYKIDKTICKAFKEAYITFYDSTQIAIDNNGKQFTLSKKQKKMVDETDENMIFLQMFNILNITDNDKRKEILVSLMEGSN